LFIAAAQRPHRSSQPPTAGVAAAGAGAHLFSFALTGESPRRPPLCDAPRALSGQDASLLQTSTTPHDRNPLARKQESQSEAPGQVAEVREIQNQVGHRVRNTRGRLLRAIETGAV